jgi:autoinducer 2 (AI-2) kinase
VLGDLNDRVAAAVGLPEGLPVHVGGGDAQFGCLGVGGMGPGKAVIVGGSTTPVMLTTNEPLSDPLRYPWVSTHLRPGLWAAETNAGHTGMIYKWFRDTFARAQVDEAAARGLGPYHVLNNLAAEAPIGSDGLLVLAPNPRWAQDTWQRKAPYSFHDFSVSHSLGHVARAIMEAVCYSVRGNVEQLRRAAGRPFDKLLFTGGSSTVPLWAQMMADVLGQPLHVPQVQEAAGAAGAQLILWGQRSSEVLPPAQEVTYEPDAARSEQYQPHYRRYLEVFERMQEHFAG